MPRYIDADKMVADTEAMRRVADGIEIDGIIKYINDHATADVAPVVRCKDCRHSYETSDGRVCSYGVCVDCAVADDFYCASGERKDGGADE